MRFFRSFRLLHRRTKSESDIISAFINPSTSDTSYYYGTRGDKNPSKAVAAAAASGTSDYHPDIGLLPFDPQELYTKPTYIYPTSSNHVTDVLDVEVSVSKPMTKNLRDDVADLHRRMAEMRKALNVEMTDKRYHKCQSDLRAEHIMALEAEVSRHEAIQSILARVGLSKEVLERALAADNDAGRSGEQVIASAFTTEGTRIEYPSSGGIPHPPDQYNAALNMTLTVRRELKRTKKISKFWKRVAQNGSQNLDTITPSPSNISSVYEPLGAERKKAVDDLVAKRRLNHLVNKNTASKRPSTISSVSSNSTILAPKAFENLPPLASESIKIELGRITNNSKVSNLGSGSSKQDVLTPDVSIKSSIDISKSSGQLRTPEKQVTDAKVRFIPASPRYPSPNPDIIPAKVDKKRNLLMVSTRTFVSAVSASLRKSAASNRSMTQRLRSTHSRENSDNDLPFDNSAFDDVTRFSSLTSTWPITPITAGHLPNIPFPFEHGESSGHITDESLSSRNADSIFDIQTTPTTAATTPAQTPASKLPVLNYSRHASPNVTPEKTPKKTCRNVANKLTRTQSTSSPTLKEGSALPISIRQPGARKYSLTPTSPTRK